MIGDFEQKLKIEEMIAFKDEKDNVIKIEDIYNSFRTKKSEIIEKMKTQPNSSYALEISEKIKVEIVGIPQETIIIKFNNTFELELLEEPVKLKIIYSDKTIDADLVSFNQYDYIRTKFKSPLFHCKTCNYKTFATVFEFIPHNHHDIYIIEDKIIEKIDIKNFNDFFKKFEKTNVKEFETILEFDKNSDLYFNKFKRIDLNKKFIFIPNIPLRLELMSFLASTVKEEKNNIIFSLSGIGKSFSAIYQLKYRFDLSKFGTLYLHCKFYAKSMEVFDYKSVRKVLIDEIKFLFRNNYDYYIKACNLIEEFMFTYQKDHIDLINSLLSLLDDGKIYIIVFDQYRKKYDLNNKINKIINEFSIKKNFKFTKIMSMNEEDVKDIKISRLLNGEAQDFSSKTLIKEIVAKDYNPFESDETINFVLNQIGKNIKNYNELKNIIENSTQENKDDNIKSYISSKREEIKKKLLEFFDINKEKIYNIHKLLMFSIDYEYDINEIKNIYKTIPFKYFDIIKEQNHYKIKYCYECIQEIVKELVGELFKKNSSIFVHLMDSDDIQEGNKGYIFEEMVVDFFSPNKYPLYRINDLEIHNSFQIPKFIPKDNEINIPFLENKITLKKTTYLIKQKIFGGKNIDFALLDNTRAEPLLFVFQVSILKRIIFSKEYLTEQLGILINYIKYFIDKFEINESNVFFGYIFSCIKSDTKEFQNMCKNCKKEDLSFCFYDFRRKCLLDEEQKHILNSITDMISWPFIIEPKILKNVTTSDKAFFPSDNNKPYFPLTKFDKIKILSIIRFYIDSTLSFLDYEKSGLYKKSSNKQYIYYFCKTSIQASQRLSSYLVFNFDNSTYVFDLNRTNIRLEMKSTIFDIYSVS